MDSPSTPLRRAPPSSTQSSPAAASSSSARRRKSRFTFRQLAQLGGGATACPLRVVAHIDLDAFYAQCEQVRLGLDASLPLAVQQWQGLIAINYPARAFGLSRHVTITEARRACPHIVLQHVATWREGDERWAYHDDAFANIATHKVSLDPYRLESRKILGVIKDALPPAPLQRVEKASIDEVFLDLSAHVHSLLLARFPELGGPPPYDDPTERLPAPPTTALDWHADALVDLDAGQSEYDDPDWDDVTMLIGSEIVRGVRAAIREKLRYTCSAGIARNKMLSKLGSGHKKPNSQTVVRNRAVQHFLNDMKFTKIRNLGGKLGDDVVAMFNTDNVKDLLDVSLERMKALGDDTAVWLYNTIRGEDTSEVNPRTQIKSMLSAKSFRPSVNALDVAVRWLRIFVADIFSRLVEEGVLENKRRPKTINLHHRQGGQMRSKQVAIPSGRPIDEAMLFDLAKNLLAQVVADGRAWPCANLSLSVGGFEEGLTNNKGIGGFLVRGEEAKALQQPAGRIDSDPSADNGPPPAKRRRLSPPRINQFFPKHEESTDRDSVEFEDVPSGQPGLSSDPPLPATSSERPRLVEGHSSVEEAAIPIEDEVTVEDNQDHDRDVHVDAGVFICPRCKKKMLADQKEEHDDWHFAQALQEQDRPKPSTVAAASSHRASRPVAAPTTKPQPRPPKGRGRPPGQGLDGKGVERGQQRLAFG